MSPAAPADLADTLPPPGGVSAFSRAWKSLRSPRNAAWALFGIALLLRLVFLLVSDNQDGDAFARIHLARNLVDQKTWNPTEVWLPVHFWIISIPYALGFSSQLWPRLLTVLAGAASVPFGFLIAEGLFGITAGWITGMVLAFNPLHIRFSVVTVSEGFLIFFITAGLWCFLKYVREGNLGHLILGGLALNLASGQRMEAWLILPLLATGTTFDRFLLGRSMSSGRRRRSMVFILGSGIFVLLWSLFSWRVYGDPVHIATLNAQRVAADPVFQASSVWYRFAFWPAVLLASLGPLIFPAGIAAAARSGFRGPRRIHGLMFFAFLAVYYVQNFRSGMITDARYGLLLVWLLALNLGFLFREGIPWVRASVWMTAPAVWLLIVLALAQGPFGIVSAKMRSISPRPQVESDVHRIAGWLRLQGDPGTIVLGPGLPKYGPWLSLLDDWYPEQRVKVIKLEESLSQALDAASHGFLVVGRTAPILGDLERFQRFGNADLVKVEAAGEYVVFRWSVAPGRLSGLQPRERPIRKDRRTGEAPGKVPAGEDSGAGAAGSGNLPVGQVVGRAVMRG